MRFGRVAKALWVVLGMAWAAGGLDVALAAETIPAAVGSEKIVPTVTVLRSSPVEYFRRLLGMTAQERERALADRKPEQRAVLLAKVEEYARMPEKERELRFRLLQLRVYLLPLLQVPLEKRGAYLAQIPVSEQALVQGRLQDWDRLSVAQRDQILGDPTRMHYFLYRPQGVGRLDSDDLAKITPIDRRPQMEEALKRWRGISESERHEMMARLVSFRKLGSKQRQLVLETVPAPDRKPVEQALQRIADLSIEQRAGVVAGIDRLAGFSADERDRFMLQAERWSRMTAEERKMWRDIMSRRTPAPNPAGAIPRRVSEAAGAQRVP